MGSLWVHYGFIMGSLWVHYGFRSGESFGKSFEELQLKSRGLRVLGFGLGDKHDTGKKGGLGLRVPSSGGGLRGVRAELSTGDRGAPKPKTPKPKTPKP